MSAAPGVREAGTCGGGACGCGGCAAACARLAPLAVRVPQWPSALSAAVAAARRRAFSWAGHNCLAFALECAAALLGARVGEDLRARCAGWMSSERRAMRSATRLEALIDGLLGRERRVAVALAQRGDWVLLGGAGLRAVGVCLGQVVAAQGPQGLALRPTGEGLCAWRI